MQKSLAAEQIEVLFSLKEAPLESFNLDKKLERLVPLFNKLPNIATRFSCSGHPPEKPQGYLVFYASHLEQAHSILFEILWDAFTILHKDEPHSHHQLELKIVPMHFIDLEDETDEEVYFPTLGIEFFVYDEIMQDDYITALETAVENYLSK